MLAADSEVVRRPSGCACSAVPVSVARGASAGCDGSDALGSAADMLGTADAAADRWDAASCSGPVPSDAVCSISLSKASSTGGMSGALSVVRRRLDLVISRS